MAGNARPFIDILREHKRGETLDLLTDRLHELTQAVGESGKKGELTIKLTLKPAGETGAVSLFIDPILKPPKVEPPESLYFLTPDCNLTKQSPQQILDLAGNSGPTLVHKGVA